MAGLSNLSDEEVLIAGVAVFVKGRDLHAQPPQPTETLQEIGVGPTNLDVPLRAWINAKFRKPNGWPVFRSGDLTTDMTWDDFKTKVLTYTPPAAAGAFKRALPRNAPGTKGRAAGSKR